MLPFVVLLPFVVQGCWWTSNGLQMAIMHANAERACAEMGKARNSCTLVCKIFLR